MAISCRVTRGELTESIHVAFAVVVDKNRQVIFSSGDPHYLTCIRSSLKPFQAAAAIEAMILVYALGGSDEDAMNACRQIAGDAC